jgi:hypothetical protein
MLSTSLFNQITFTMYLTRAEINVYAKSYLHGTLIQLDNALYYIRNVMCKLHRDLL